MAGISNEVLYGKNADFTSINNQSVQESNGLFTNGQIWIGSTIVNAGGTHVNVGTVTSSTLTIGYSSPNLTINVPGGAAVTSVATANATPQFVLTGSTETVDFNKANLALGSNMASVTSGSANVAYGPGVLNLVTSGNNNTGVGNLSLQSVVTGNSNTAMGFGAARFVTGSNNTIFGVSSGTAITSGSSNIALGSGALSAVVTGVSNIAIGVNAGTQYNAAESSNIILGNSQGTNGESNVMRLGTQGSSAGQQLQTYIAGVINTVSGRVVKLTTPGAYPYTTLTTDYVILVDTSSARTINLIATPVTGTTYRIKDNVGTAAAFNITITPAAGTIDGAASLVVNSNWGSVDLCYSGTSWRIL